MTPALVPELKRRLAAQALLKGIGIPAFMALFFVGYFATLQHPLRPVTLMPACAIDRWVGFQAWTVPLYCTLWVYVALPPSLCGSRAELLRFGAAATLLATAGLATFALWPTAVPRVGSGFLKRFDLGGNACPSLHAGFTVFSALCLQRLLGRIGAPAWLPMLSWVWAAGILYATLATKQHVLTDAVAGAALGAAAAQFFSSSRSNDPPSRASSAARR